MISPEKSDYVWVEQFASEEYSHPVGAKVVEVGPNGIKVVDDNGEEQWLNPNRKLRLMHATSVQGVENMIQLYDIHSSSVLRNLAIRYSQKLIYTYVGSILVAVNPYMQLPIYTSEHIRLYKNRQIGELPPHIFGIANSAYTNLSKSDRDQCILLSGESGAGKTESAKLLIRFLTKQCYQHSWIGQQIINANPIIEAFGNAKTLYNNNSSRFAKYFDIYFNKSGTIDSARIVTYLLESSRITNQAINGQNYRIFYSLLNGLAENEKNILFLSAATDYFYLNMSQKSRSQCQDDVCNDLFEIRSAMKVLLFRGAETWSIFRILASILHIGNIKCNAIRRNDLEITEILDPSHLYYITELLQLDRQTLTAALTMRNLTVGNEKVMSCLTPEQCLNTRDALARGIYERLFAYIINKVNAAIFRSPKDTYAYRKIGILDIFGFEDFTSNSFEQLCINYANETLKQFFLKVNFKIEQSECIAENVAFERINFVDNENVLNMLAHSSMNILSIIDDESVLVNGTDQSMLNIMHMNHEKNQSYLKPKSELNRTFGVCHYAGAVFYDSKGFIEKNRSEFSSSLATLLKESSFKFLSSLFESDSQQNEAKTYQRTGIINSFRHSLESLISQIGSCETYFINCIRPNEFKQPLRFDRPLVYKQICSYAMIESINMIKGGYSIRYDCRDFVQKYRIFVKGLDLCGNTNYHDAASKICQTVFGSEDDHRLGLTKIFMKEHQSLLIKQEYYQILSSHATTIQKIFRGWSQTKRFKYIRMAATIIQQHWRGYLQLQKYKQIKIGVVRLQAILRSQKLVCHFKNVKRILVRFQDVCIQAHCRGALTRNSLTSRSEDSECNRWTIVCAKSEREADILSETSIDDHYENDSKLIEQIFGLNMPAHKHSENYCHAKRPEMLDFDESMDDLKKYRFDKFAAAYFQGNATGISDFMGIYNGIFVRSIEEKIGHFNGFCQIHGTEFQLQMLLIGASMMKRLSISLNYLMKQYYEDYRRDCFEGTEQDSCQQRRNLSLIKKVESDVSIINGGARSSIDDRCCYTDLLREPGNNLELVQFIIGHGILRHDLRDEIYCQICKQLTSNPSRTYRAKGWILLSLCSGCFIPSDRFIKYLYCFIRERAENPYYLNFIEERLARTAKNGGRKEPPNHTELQAIRLKQPILIPLTLMDGRTVTIEVDSATTMHEFYETICDFIELKDRFGFAIYIAFMDKVTSLGSKSEHLMDAISQCEQYMQDQEYHCTNWRLFFRKEIFSPWHDPTEDPKSTNLIYQQIIRGVKSGEYPISKEEDIAQIAAQQYYIEHGGILDVDELESSLNRFLPEFACGIGFVDADNEQRWLQFVLNAYRKQLSSTNPTISETKHRVITFAKDKWPLLFSRYYEIHKVDGPNLLLNDVKIAINWRGICIMNQHEDIYLELSFPEIHELSYKNANSDALTVSTVDNILYKLHANAIKEIGGLIDYFIVNLKKRSKYAVAIEDNESQDILNLKGGDLLILDDEYAVGSNRNVQCMRGENTRTGLHGDIPSSMIHILPCISKPSRKIMELFTKEIDYESPISKQVALICNDNSSDRLYTLERFCADNFKQYPRRALAISNRFDHHPTLLWSHSYEPINVPLLKKLEGKPEPSHEAVLGYMAIMVYMGDHPARRPVADIALTDQIFRGPLKYEILRDEIYCQIMKQLTNNFNPASVEKGWQLLWLCVGLIPPGRSLLIEVNRFLQSRQSYPLASDCRIRLERALRSGCREYPPHPVELEAIQHRTTEIFHKVYFPNHSHEVIEVNSYTRIRDCCIHLAARLGLKSADGFSLFLRMNNRVTSVMENNFFFDFVRQLSSEKVQKNKESSLLPANYQVFLMKKLWINTKPGEDRVADILFHFPQELPKYLRGYHNLSSQQAFELAALLLRARSKGDKTAPFAQLSSIIYEIVPRDMLKLYSSGDWRKHVIKAYTGRVESMPPNEAKIAFLKQVAEFPTFASAFFEVKQSSDPSMSDQVLLSINQYGVTLYCAETKKLLVNYPFHSISNWTSGNTYFHMTVENIMKRSRNNRVLLETTLGYKMDDLITSYIKKLLSMANSQNFDVDSIA